jgi:hypothetical protein
MSDTQQEEAMSEPAPVVEAAPLTEAPASAAAEVQALLPRDGSVGTGVTVLLTLIAVGGGGAAWKFYTSFAKQKHEQRMKELEIKEKKIELQDDKDDHKACEAARAADRAALEAKIEALEAHRAASLSFDPEDLQDRISQIEMVLKKAPSDKKKKP